MLKRPETLIDPNWYVLSSGDHPLFETLRVGWAKDQLRLNFRTDDLERTSRDLPAGLDDWTHEEVHVSEDNFYSKIKPDELDADGMEQIFDCTPWLPLNIVSGPLKELLEQLAPESAEFFRFTYIDRKTGEQSDPDYWYWLPKHRMDFEPQIKPSLDQRMSESCWSGEFSDATTTWEFYNNRKLQNFLNNFPFFAMSVNSSVIAIRPDIYKAIKDHGFTGFEEWDPLSSFVLRPKTNTVGFIYYRK